LIKKIVSFFLDKQVAPSKGASTGQVIIGGVDKAHCDIAAGPTTFYLTSSSSGDYRFIVKLTGIEMGNYDTTSGTYYGYFDTAVSTIMLPSADLKGIFDIVDPTYDWDTGLYTVDCSSIDSISALYIAFSSYLKVPATNWIVDLDLEDKQCALALELTSYSLYSGEDYVFGTPVYRSQCLVADLEYNSILAYDHIKST